VSEWTCITPLRLRTRSGILLDLSLWLLYWGDLEMIYDTIASMPFLSTRTTTYNKQSNNQSSRSSNGVSTRYADPRHPDSVRSDTIGARRTIDTLLLTRLAFLQPASSFEHAATPPLPHFPLPSPSAPHLPLLLHQFLLPPPGRPPLPSPQLRRDPIESTSNSRKSTILTLATSTPIAAVPPPTNSPTPQQKTSTNSDQPEQVRAVLRDRIRTITSKSLPFFTDINARSLQHTFTHSKGLLFANHFAQIAGSSPLLLCYA
jgi:hypothetical protein